jgi:energy-coupling factor transporter ATP-binding protein EcfA2
LFCHGITQSPNEISSVAGIDKNGDEIEILPNSRDFGVRPILIRKDTIPAAQIRRASRFEYGEYPQALADLETSETLEFQFQAGGLKGTRKIYTVNISNYKSPGRGSLELTNLREYMLADSDDGRYIRIIATPAYDRPDDGIFGETMLGDRKIIRGRPYWVKVLPIEWIPFSGTPNAYISSHALYSGIPFNDQHDYSGDFERTFLFLFNKDFFIDDAFTQHGLQAEFASNIDRRTPKASPNSMFFVSTDRLRDARDVFRKAFEFLGHRWDNDPVMGSVMEIGPLWEMMSIYMERLEDATQDESRAFEIDSEGKDLLDEIVNVLQGEDNAELINDISKAFDYPPFDRDELGGEPVEEEIERPAPKVGENAPRKDDPASLHATRDKTETLLHDLKSKISDAKLQKDALHKLTMDAKKEADSIKWQAHNLQEAVSEIEFIQKQYGGDPAKMTHDLIELQKTAETLKNDVAEEQKKIRAMEAIKAREIHISFNDKITGEIDLNDRHDQYEEVLKIVACGCVPYLVGPAGSGKTTIIEQIAADMKLEYYSIQVNGQTSEYNIIGYKDAVGKYVGTDFRRAYESGGVFSFEEIDAGNPNVLTVINNCIGPKRYSFPDKKVDRHRDFIVAASANTFGRGANMQYIGRNPIDAATLDRFVMAPVDYSRKLEFRLCGDKKWLAAIWAVREKIEEFNMPLVASTRAVVNGQNLLRQFDKEYALNATVLKGAKRSDAEKLTKGLGESARSWLDYMNRNYGTSL